MHPDQRLTEALRRAGDRPIVLSGTRKHTSATILARFEQIAQALNDRSTSCVLCVSDEPEDILACLCLPSERVASVLFVPDYLRQEIPAFVEVVGARAIVLPGGLVNSTNHSGVTRDPGDEVLLVTSGTTGKPKVVRHKLRSLFARIRIGTPDQRVWLLTYLPSSFAGIQVLLTAALAGELAVQAPRGYPETLALSAEQRVTHLSCTPTFLRALIAAGARDSMMPCIRQITLGGEIADQRTLTTARELFPRTRISHIYAATETGALFSVSDGREGFPKSWLQQGMEGVRFKVLDETLHVQSSRAMVGYAGCERVTDWIDTGDLVRVEGDRVLFVGRRDRRINVGGTKILPEDVERAIMEVPGVVDAVVTGVPSPLSGEAVLAEVVPANGMDAEELRQRIFAHIRSRLANHQVPRILRFAPGVTLSPAGKKAASI